VLRARQRRGRKCLEGRRCGSDGRERDADHRTLRGRCFSRSDFVDRPGRRELSTRMGARRAQLRACDSTVTEQHWCRHVIAFEIASAPRVPSLVAVVLTVVLTPLLKERRPGGRGGRGGRKDPAGVLARAAYPLPRDACRSRDRPARGAATLSPCRRYKDGVRAAPPVPRRQAVFPLGISRTPSVGLGAVAEAKRDGARLGRLPERVPAARCALPLPVPETRRTWSIQWQPGP
jgi:hypothetical protein